MELGLISYDSGLKEKVKKIFKLKEIHKRSLEDQDLIGKKNGRLLFKN